jgi:hypothetical protein
LKGVQEKLKEENRREKLKYQESLRKNIELE